MNWTKIAGIILRNRIAIIVSVLVLTGFMGYHSQFLRISYNHANLIPESDSTYIQGVKFQEVFKDESMVMILSVQDSTFYQYEKFVSWIEMGDEIRKLKGVQGVLSPGHFWMLKKNSEEKRFEAHNPTRDSLNSQQDVDSLSRLFHSLPFYKGLLYNDSTHSYTMAITIQDEIVESKGRESLMNEIERIASVFSEKFDIKIHYSGLPYTRTILSILVREEIIRFIYLALLVTALILLILFRSFRVVFFSMLVVAIGVIIAMGTMVLFGYEITIISGMIPPLVIVIGIPNSVYFLNKYQVEYRHHGNKIRALQRVIIKTGKAALMTNLTTAVGFGTFILTHSKMLVEFGIVTSINVMVVYVLSLTLIPIIFSFLPPPNARQTNHLDKKLINLAVDRLVHIVVYYRKTSIFITGIIVVISLYGITLMQTTGFLVDDISPEHVVAKDLKYLEDNFRGIMPMDIMIDTRKKKGVLSPVVLKKIDELQQRLDSFPEFSKSISIVDGVKYAKQAFYNGKESYYSLPNSQERGVLLSYLSRSTEGSRSLSSFIDSTGQITRVSMRIADVGTIEWRRIMSDLEPIVKDIFPAEDYTVSIVGASVNFYKGTGYLIKNLYSSLALAIVIIAGLMALVFRSGRMVMISLVPNVVPLILTAAVMGFFGIPIKPSTILVFSIAFGISVDGTIHYLSRYRQDLELTNWDIGKSVIRAMREVGVSMIYTAVILFFGFGIFMVSDFGGTFALGLLVSFTLMVAMLANFVLLPALLLTLEKMITTKSFSEDPIIDVYEDADDNEFSEEYKE
ncbi:MAG: MMPL family transporter [Bacteroidales bacterium]|nr:MMPL family transporter [Bacteroidales bacterium]